MYRTTTPSLILVAFLVACEGPDDDLFTGQSSTSTTVTTGQGSTTSASSGSTGGSSSSSSTSSSTSSSGGSGGTGPAFAAACSGTLDCPTVAACATWAYDASDDGAQTTVTAVVTPMGSEPCTQEATFEDAAEPQSGPRDEVTVQCGPQAWTLSLDREAMVLYIAADPFSWTPACGGQ